MLEYIRWNISPEIFKLGGLEVRYYGLFFAIAFILGFQIITKMFDRDGISSRTDWADKLFMYVFIGTFVGARLGHVFFYDWESYSKNILEIFKVWHGGLASHGGAIGVIVAVWLFSRNISKRSVYWTFDRLVIVVALAGCFIRLGNLMNSEIYGVNTSLPWGFIFTRNNETIPKHPTQIYEALCYFMIFIIGSWIFWKTNLHKKEGFIMGLCVFLIFISRFFIEFIKNDQEIWESNMTLNMGQLLSIPFIIGGIILMIYALKRPDKNYEFPSINNK